MKQITLFLGLALCSCNTPSKVKVDGIEAQSAARIGGKDFLAVKKGDTTIIISNDNEDSFREGAKTGRFGLGAWALTDLAGTITGGIESVQADKTAAGVSNTVAKEGTKQAAIQATTDQAKIAAEAAVVGAGQ